MLTLRKEDEKLSLCCRAKIFGSLGDGVIIGTCSTCDTNVARVNPRTGKREWLNGASPWTTENAPEDKADERS